MEINTISDEKIYRAIHWLLNEIVESFSSSFHSAFKIHYLPSIDKVYQKGSDIYFPLNLELWEHKASELWTLLIEQEKPIESALFNSDPLRFAFLIASDELSYGLNDAGFFDTHGRSNVSTSRATEIAEAIISSIYLKLGLTIQEKEPETVPKLLLTFDVDNLLVSWKGMLYRYWKKPRAYTFNWKEEKKVFQSSINEILQSLEKESMKAIFFLKAPLMKQKYDAKDYLQHSETQDLIRKIIDHPLIEIGLHSSYDASYQDQLIEKEHIRLQSIVNKPITIHRAHYLRYNQSSTFSRLEKLGYNFDSSVAYPNLSGSKTGFLNVHSLYNHRVNESMKLRHIPLTFMDIPSQAFSDKKYDYGLKKLELQLQHLRTMNGLIAWNFHQTTFDKLLHPHNAMLYKKALSLIKSYSIKTIHSHEI